MNLDDAEVLRTFTSRLEAEIVAGLLKAEGIETRLLSEFPAFVFPDLQLTNQVRLLVYAADEPRARETLQAMLTQQAADVIAEWAAAPHV